MPDRNPSRSIRSHRAGGSDRVSSTNIDRRTYLAALAGAGTASIAGCSFLDADEDSPTTTLAGEQARELAERFAPSFYFDEYEKWFPTDPRPYEVEANGEPVVGGFDAFNGYHERYEESTSPPDPVVFYHAVEYDDSPLAVVQFWQYSVFDQFSTNFHWHDWEVLHVFVDTETREPQLHVASSHSRRVPNNEFLDPDPNRIPAILVELGSHSNTLSINEQRDRFQRLPAADELADITNGMVDGLDTLAELPIAYGLPRDEGLRVPFALPELDGVPIFQDDRLPSVDRGDLLDESLVIRSLRELSSPPVDLPERQTGMIFDHVDRDGPEADVEYDLVPSSELEHIEAFTGPQLSFEFAVPDVLEDAISGHITTVGVPWHSSRYDNPAADISDPNHRATLAKRYEAIGEPAPIGTVIASVTQAVADDDAPADEGVTTEPSTIEGIALLESEPEVVPTFGGGTTVLRGVPGGDHRLTINGAGVAPHSEEVSVRGGDELTPAGADGDVPLVANEHAVKLEVDPRDADSDLTQLAIEDDFAGRLYDAPLSGPDAVYVHRGGAYTTEVRDVNDEIGAFRVNPTDESRIRIEEPRTGLGSLIDYVAAVAGETAGAVENLDDDRSDAQSDGGSGDPVDQLAQVLAAVAEEARRAADRAAAGDRAGADQRLGNVQDRLDRVASRLAEADAGLPNDRKRAIAHRLEQMRRRTGQALEAGEL